MRGDGKRTLAEINQHFRLHGISFCSKKFEIFKGKSKPKENKYQIFTSMHLRVEVEWKIKSSLMCYYTTTTTRPCEKIKIRRRERMSFWAALDTKT